MLFGDEEVLELLRPVQGFDDSSMDYYNFLEALWRVAWDYPFLKEEQVHYNTIEKRFRWLVDMLSRAYKSYISDYEKYLDEKEPPNNAY